jgi:hypothetical protein
MADYPQEPCGCNCVTIREVSVSDHDLLYSVLLLGTVKLMKASEDSRTLIQTNRYQRRELIRNGISYKEL